MAIRNWTCNDDFIILYDSDEGEQLNRASYTSHAELIEKYPLPFRLLDDDGNLMYEGRAKEELLSPLDEYGEPNAGCTQIQYRDRHNEWVTING